MAVLAPIPGLARVSVEGVCGLRPWVNVFHVRPLTDAAMDQPTVDDIATAVMSGWVAHFLPSLTTDVHPKLAVAIDLGSNVGLQGQATSSAGGTIGGPTSPASVCALINWRIALRYRGGHPRTYLPGVPEGAVDVDGNLQTGAGNILVTLQAGVDAFLADLEANTGAAGSLHLAVPHYTVKGVPVVAPNIPVKSDILSGLVNPIMGSQRRRVR